MKKGDKYGAHRVIEPIGVLTQAARKIDNNMNELYSNEILVDVTSLNIDSASFTQIKNDVGSDEEKLKERILAIVDERGKMQNPVTGSGGMFIGVVKAVGADLAGDHRSPLQPGDRI
ncbi:MAG: L-erythro-3,5-diaminohexanoate dehydrogenase, partial [Defluviitaleaceae bacterium]|nr:L-erythro-3,5-diaminohexanoate dehydrogenase [Defluviitaleaceae bacterium]